jgi:hypothetical protein
MARQIFNFTLDQTVCTKTVINAERVLYEEKKNDIRIMCSIVLDNTYKSVFIFNSIKYLKKTIEKVYIS